eukprot:TRINITY_DN949_c0_g1_i1.p2 TRINITY_DN949_c0_g1~~TRINITY_DN949_c0_g1_i1.p2  ORF type:complete len:211 (+),score=42.47 TRINITY_DN949_c0_g1_i1:46-633(+)
MLRCVRYSLVVLSVFLAVCSSQTLVTDAIVVLTPTANNNVSGIVRFQQSSSGVRIVARVQGLAASSTHGFHVHESGDISDPAGLATGGHFNPAGNPHACPPEADRHAGDLGNIQSNAQGVAVLDAVDAHLPLNMPGIKGETILGRGMIVHASPDDCKTQPTGNAGARLSQGVVGTCSVNCRQTYNMDTPDEWPMH